MVYRNVVLSGFGKIVLLAGAVILGHQILVEPVTGLADNGDFLRITSVFRLTPVNHPDDPDRFFRYVVKRYRYVKEQPIVFHQITSEQLTMAVAVAVNWALSKDGFFDIRMMGAMHGLLWLLALYLAWPLVETQSRWRNAAAAGLILMVFGDVGYVQYSNSLYTDAGSVIYLLLTLVVAFRLMGGHGGTYWNSVALGVFLVLFALSKSQHSILAIVLLGGLPLIVGGTRKQLALLAAAGILATVVMMVAVSPELRRTASYNVLFYGILPNVPSTQETLEELGLESWMSAYKGTSTYSETTGMKSPLVRQRIDQHVTQAQLAYYFLRHPEVSSMLINKGLKESATQRIPGFGNFTKDAGRPERDQSRAYSVWSFLKGRILGDRAGLHFGYFLLGVVGLSAGLWRMGKGRLIWGVAVISGAAAAALAIGCLADVLDTGRHLYLCTFLFDFLFVNACIVWLQAGDVRRPA